MARDTLLTYGAFQLGAVIIQKGKPITFYGRRLTDAQQRYTVTERELLRTVETLMEFRTILPGQKLRIYTYYENLTCNFFNTDRVLRWRITVEEYGPYIEYIKGERKIAADRI